ncbi:MAG TPA: amidohydrolase family protein [Holophagaceae bacterium]|nr:amidohydrolase family protein [Holophagaceae bacterium]
MRLTSLALASGLLAATIPVSAQAAPPRPASATLIRAGRLLDVRAGAVRPDQGLLVRGDRIVAVGDYATVAAQAPADAGKVDLSAETVLPGLIDCHTHVLLQDDTTAAQYDEQLLKESIPYRTLRAAAAARRALEWGFTTLRDLETEGAMYADVDIKRAIAKGVVPGPRLFVATRAFSATGMYPLTGYSWELEVPKGVQIVDGVDEIRKGVREQVSRGADWVKVYVDRAYWLAEDGRLRSKLNFTADELKAFADEAHRLGRPCAAHAMGWDGIDAALRAGFDTIEHGAGFDEGLFDRAVQQGAYWCPTLYVGAWVAQGRGGVWLKLPEVEARALKLGLKKGVRIANGSDAGGFAWTENPAKELQMLVKDGMTPWQAIQAATLTAGRLLRAEQDLGTLEPGRYADLIAVKEDPLADITALQRVDFVMKGGEVAKGPAVH